MGRKLHYKLGSFYRTDDRSGFPQRAENTKQEWTGLIVDKSLWEIRQPQDFVKGVKDDQSVPKPRPLPPNIFDGPTYYTLSQNAGPGSLTPLLTENGLEIETESNQPIIFPDPFNILFLNTTSRINVGDPGGVMLDIGQWFNFTFTAILSATAVMINQTIPSSASSGNSVIDYVEHIPPLPYANLSV